MKVTNQQDQIYPGEQIKYELLSQQLYNGT